MGKISYASAQWKYKQETVIQEQNYNQLLHTLSAYTKDFDSKCLYDPINFYDVLSSIYSELAESCYLETENPEESRVYYYLAAKAGEAAFVLHEKGDSTSPALEESISKYEGAVWYALCAILAGDYDLAMRLAPEGTILRDLLEGKNFEISRYTKELESLVFLDGYKALFERDGEALGEKLVERIQNLRNMSEDAVIIDVLGTALLKLAKKMGIICRIKAAELPGGLLEENIVEHKEITLPKYKMVGKTVGE